MVIGDAADHTLIGELLQAVKRVDDAQVGGEVGAIKVRVYMAELQAAGVVRESLEVEIREVPFFDLPLRYPIAAAKRGARHDCYARLLERGRLGESVVFKSRHQGGRCKLAHVLVVIVHRHCPILLVCLTTARLGYKLLC